MRIIQWTGLTGQKHIHVMSAGGRRKEKETKLWTKKSSQEITHKRKT